MGGKLEDVTRGQAGEHEAGHQLGIEDSDPVTADEAGVLVHLGQDTEHVGGRHVSCRSESSYCFLLVYL